MEPVHRIFRAEQGGLRPRRHEGVFGEGPGSLNAVEQLEYAKPWFATYNTLAVRKAIDDEMQTVLSGKEEPAEAVEDAQKNADEILWPYVERTALKLPPTN